MVKQDPVAVYECTSCGYRYIDEPRTQDDCRRCGSNYMKWLNYKEKRDAS